MQKVGARLGAFLLDPTPTRSPDRSLAHEVYREYLHASAMRATRHPFCEADFSPRGLDTPPAVTAAMRLAVRDVDGRLMRTKVDVLAAVHGEGAGAPFVGASRFLQASPS